MPPKPLPPGIVRTATGYRAFVHVTPWPGYPKGRLLSKRFTRTPTYEPTLKEMQAWREERRVEAQRRKNDSPVPALPSAPELPSEDWTRLTRSPDGWCYVYFVRVGDRVKIGRAVELGRRILTLQAAHPDPLALVLSIPAHAALAGDPSALRASPHARRMVPRGAGSCRVHRRRATGDQSDHVALVGIG